MTPLLRRSARTLAAASVLPAALLLPHYAVAAPTIAWKAPAEGGALSGNVQGPPNCIVDGTNVRRVMFYINGQWTNTDGNLDNGLGCWIDTTKYKDGSYTLTAVAYDDAGATATAQRSVVIRNSTASSGPTIAWKAPAEGGALSGNVQGAPDCIVDGANIQRVMFYINGEWTNTDGNHDNGLGCWLDTKKYKDGKYTMKAVAYDADGKTAEASRTVTIQNTVSAPAPSGPTISWKAPAEGGALSGNVQGPPHCVVNGTNIQRVMFYLNGKWTNTDGNLDNGLGCWVDTTKYANGSYTLKAVAYDASGNTVEASRSVVIKNGTSAPDSGSGSGGNAGSIDSGDILGWASGDTAFSNQNGYSAQVLGQYPSASSIPEGGIHGFKLSNGETIRLGKATDPTNSTRKALAFQLHPNDTATSGSKRSEIKFPKNVEFDKTYWVAFKVFVRDWGTLSSSDAALFGTQLHSGDNSKGYSPSFGIYTKGGKTMHIEVRGSGMSGTKRYAEQAIPFGRWMDFVFKVRQSTGSNGLLQAWLDGRQIVNHAGPIGYKTSELDYFKFGYYNWSGAFDSARKVLMRSPVIVRDPSGSKYNADTLRAYINK